MPKFNMQIAETGKVEKLEINGVDLLRCSVREVRIVIMANELPEVAVYFDSYDGGHLGFDSANVALVSEDIDTKTGKPSGVTKVMMVAGSDFVR